jgi:hypothetical protein
MSFRCTALPNRSDPRAARSCRRVEQVAAPIALVDGAEDPAVAVEVGELRVLELLVELRRADLAEELRIAPVALERRLLGIAAADRLLLGILRFQRLVGVHLLAVDFVCPTRCSRSRW